MMNFHYIDKKEIISYLDSYSAIQGKDKSVPEVIK